MRSLRRYSPSTVVFRTARERRYWLAAAVLLTAIYATLAWVRPLADFLRAANLLRTVVVLAFLGSAATAAAIWLRSRPGRWEAVAMALFGLVYGGAVLRMERAEEALHFLEYGAFAALLYAALDERRRAGPPGGWLARPGVPSATTVLATAAAGWLDEGIQGLLPSRVYDLRDVAFNATAGVIVTAAFAVRTRIRRREGPPA